MPTSAPHRCISHQNLVKMTASLMKPELRIHADAVVAAYLGLLNHRRARGGSSKIYCDHTKGTVEETRYYSQFAQEASRYAVGLNDFEAVKHLVGLFLAVAEEDPLSD